MNGFLFQSPWILTCLALLPLLGLLFRFAQKKRKELLAHLGGARHEPIEKKQNERTQNEWRTRAGIALLILALARPGAHPHPESSPEGGRDLIFLLDVSRSMLGTDFRPNRLERAKEDIVRCLDSLNHDRVGLMIFAGSSSLLSPLTTDDDFFKSRLKEVIPDSVAHGSTYLQIVLEKTTDLMISPDRHGYQDLILLTDGGDQGSHPEKTIAALNASKTRLMIVGYGDPKFGSRIPLGEKGSEGFLMDEGQEVWTRLEENSLKALAHANPEGIYLYAGKPGFDLGKAYQEWSLKAPRSSLNGTPKIVYDEYFAWLLLPALILLVPFGGRLPIKGSLLILLWVGMGSGVSLHGESASNEIETMQKSVTAELDPRLHGKKAFKLGLLLAKNNRFEEALKAFQDAEERAITPEKLARTLFNQAIVEAREAGSVPNPETKLALLETAIKKMKSALLLQPGWTTAAQGLEVFYEQQAGAQKALEDQNNKKKELDQDQQNLVKELKRLLEIQRTLVKVGTKLEHSKVIPPEQKIEQIKEQKPKQQDLQIQTTAAQDKIAFLQKAIREILNNPEKKTTPANSLPPPQTPFDEPLAHIAQAVVDQKASVELLGPLNLLVRATKSEQQAATEIETAIKFLDSQSSRSQDSDSDSNENSDEDQQEMNESDDSTPSDSSMKMQGESWTDMVNHSLPKPNFSAEQILQEEEENAATRAKNKPARIEKGEKDW